MAKYVYFVDGKRRSVSRKKLLGAALKAREPGFNWAYSIFLERDDEPDLMVSDAAEYETKKPRFYTVPPCGGG
jgi:hypothetical protein